MESVTERHFSFAAQRSVRKNTTWDKTGKEQDEGLQILIGCHSETPHITTADTKVEAEPDKFSVLCLR